MYMRVGEPGHKTKERFDALLQALDADQPGPVVSYKKLFVEDRDYNQGTDFLPCQKWSFTSPENMTSS